MITNESTAAQIRLLILDIGRRLDESVAQVQHSCPPDEFQRYRRAVGIVMGEILLQVMNPLYAQHPEIKPKGLE